MSKIIKIGHERLCNCPEKYLSCVDPKQWMQNQIGVWNFKYESRDVRKKDVHPATFPIELPKRVIEQFTHKGELVLDPFVGSGTTLVAASDLERNAIGFDLKKEYVDLANQRVQCEYRDDKVTQQIAVCDDARNILNYVEPNTVKLIVTSPPYANILNHQRKNKSRRGVERYNEQYNKVEQYSQDPKDLGTLEPPIFEKEIGSIFGTLQPVLMPTSHVLINITDAWIEGKREPLHLNIINGMRSAGYELRNTIIWDRRNIVNRIGIFGWPSSYITMGTTFEYILDFVIPK